MSSENTSANNRSRTTSRKRKSSRNKPAGLLSLAQTYLEAGLTVIPVKTDGSKQPIGSWKKYQTETPTDADLKAWFARDSVGIGIVCGEASEGLTVLDFDDADAYTEWRAIVEEASPGLLERLPAVRTPSGGAHVYVRSDSPLATCKLARRESESGKLSVLVETRAEGAYVVAPGSPPECHESNGSYTLESSVTLLEVPRLDESEFDLLVGLARSLDECPTAKGEPVSQGTSGSRPGDRYNAGTTWEEILPPHGWKKAFVAGDVTYWCRPGKVGGVSATTGFCRGDVTGDRLCIFSSNAEPFEVATYSKFGALAMLEFDGDFKKCAKELRKRQSTAEACEKDPPTDVEPITIERCVEIFSDYLSDVDTDALELILGIIASNHLPGDPGWLFLVGPPSSGKTELLRPILEHDDVVEISTLTPSALISGFEPDSGEEPSLLPQLDGKTLVIKDFTPTLQMGSENQNEIFGQLRDAYDGQMAKAMGTRTKRFKSKFNLIAAVTGEIESRLEKSTALGERFLRFRLQKGDDSKRVRRAASQANSEPTMRRELARAAFGVLASIAPDVEGPTVPEEHQEQIAVLAELLAVGRTRVRRDRNKEVTITPEPEGGSRIAKQLVRFCQAVAILHQRVEVTDHEVCIAARLVAGSLPSIVRSLILCYEPSVSSGKTWARLLEQSNLPKATFQYRLEDLVMLGVIQEYESKKAASTKGNGKKVSRKKVNYYRIAKKFRVAAKLVIDAEIET